MALVRNSRKVKVPILSTRKMAWALQTHMKVNSCVFKYEPAVLNLNELKWILF